MHYSCCCIGLSTGSGMPPILVLSLGSGLPANCLLVCRVCSIFLPFCLPDGPSSASYFISSAGHSPALPVFFCLLSPNRSSPSHTSRHCCPIPRLSLSQTTSHRLCLLPASHAARGCWPQRPVTTGFVVRNCVLVLRNCVMSHCLPCLASTVAMTFFHSLGLKKLELDFG